MPAPTPARLFFLFLAVSVVLFSRPPTTNFIFDEQEALLANPYLSGDMPYFAAFQVDFWGRPLATTIGSYRPLPNLLWRPLAFSLSWHTPWLLTCLNLVVHAGTATLIALTVKAHFRKGVSARWAPWISGGAFATFALSTEAVCSVVGLADLQVTFFAVLALFCVIFSATEHLPQRAIGLWVMPALAVCLLLGFLSKETAVTFLPLIALSALIWTASKAPREESRTRYRWTLFGGTVSASFLALAVYWALRRGLYATELRAASGSGGSWVDSWGQAVASWAGRLPLPRDPMNNPLLEAETSERWWTVSDIFARVLGQLLVPRHMSGDYSYPAQPLSQGGIVAVVGAVVFVGAALFALLGLIRVLRGRSDPSVQLVVFGVTWFVVTYFPVSGALIDLPTIRADRFLYLPSVGAALVLAGAFSHPLVQSKAILRRASVAILALFLLTQAVSARLHALEYRTDLIFWREASQSAAPSAKAHLNYGVMLGARGHGVERLRETQRAVDLAPDWAMGRIYLADTYCRLGLMDAAMTEYLVGLDRAANSKALTALSLQCIWDKGAFEGHKPALMDLAAAHPDTWLSYLVHRLRTDGAKNGGVPLKYRPRRYNESSPGAGS